MRSHDGLHSSGGHRDGASSAVSYFGHFSHVRPTVVTMEALSITAGDVMLTTVTAPRWELLKHGEPDARPPFVPHDARVEGVDDLVVAFWFDVFEVSGAVR